MEKGRVLPNGKIFIIIHLVCKIDDEYNVNIDLEYIF